MDKELLAEVKNYIRVDHDEDDGEIELFILSGETLLKSKGIEKDYDNKLYKIAIFMLVALWYDNRGYSGVINDIPYGISCVIKQINMMKDYGTVQS